MSVGRITDEERVRRLHQIDKYNEDGLTDHEISNKMGVSIDVVKRLQNYLSNLQKADISPTELAEKRSELYLELSEASVEAKKLFDMYKNPEACPRCKGECIIKKINMKTQEEYEVTCDVCKGFGGIHRTGSANKFFLSWLEAIEKKAKLYGLDNPRTDAILQQFNFHGNSYVPDMKITGKAREVSERLSKILIDQHEKRVAEN